MQKERRTTIGVPVERETIEALFREPVLRETFKNLIQENESEMESFKEQMNKFLSILDGIRVEHGDLHQIVESAKLEIQVDVIGKTVEECLQLRDFSNYIEKIKDNLTAQMMKESLDKITNWYETVVCAYVATPLVVMC